MDRNWAEQGVNAKSADRAKSVCVWFYKGSWYARQDSNLRPLAPEANSYHVYSIT
jgi:hypothetical protein